MKAAEARRPSSNCQRSELAEVGQHFETVLTLDKSIYLTDYKPIFG
jgi:hypothetical protein